MPITHWRPIYLLKMREQQWWREGAKCNYITIELLNLISGFVRAQIIIIISDRLATAILHPLADIFKLVGHARVHRCQLICHFEYMPIAIAISFLIIFFLSLVLLLLLLLLLRDVVVAAVAVDCDTNHGCKSQTVTCAPSLMHRFRSRSQFAWWICGFRLTRIQEYMWKKENIGVTKKETATYRLLCQPSSEQFSYFFIVCLHMFIVAAQYIALWER